MKTIKTLLNIMFAIITLASCSEDEDLDSVWRIRSVEGAGDSKSTINLNYDKSNNITSVEQIRDGLNTMYYPSLVGNIFKVNYEGTQGASETIFTFNTDSTLLSIYDAKATDVSRKFAYEEYNGYSRMSGYYRESSNGDTTGYHIFLWSGNEIPGIKAYGYIDGVRDLEYELVNMMSDEVIHATYTQFPIELAAVLFNQEEYLMFGLANPAKFQIVTERTTYSNLQFDSFGHWTGYTRKQNGGSNQDVTIVWEEATVSK